MKPKPPDTASTPPIIPFEQGRERLHRDMLNAVSHDLKTPLACIIGSLEIYERLKEKLSPEEINTLITTARQEAYRLDGFISNILDMVKFESYAAPVKNQLCVMDLLLEDCVIQLGQRLHDCVISITAIPAPFSVTTDPLLLMRAVGILLDNAARHGSSHPVVHVEYEIADSQVIIRIQDNGPGIPESKLEAIFTKYMRFAPPGHTHVGTGLGLPICREVMRLLGGTVTAANRADSKGAVFTLAFPA
jgi:two-component system sensor histidine kinase KdpD